MQAPSACPDCASPRLVDSNALHAEDEVSDTGETAAARPRGGLLHSTNGHVNGCKHPC